MWIGLIVLLVFAVWAFTAYDFELVVSSLAMADWKWVCLGVVLNVSLLYLRVFKWRFFHRSFKDCSFFNMTLAAFAAYTCNMVVPAKVGGFVQAWLLSKKEPIPVGQILGTLILVRLMDGISLIITGLLVFNLVEVTSDKNVLWDAYKQAGVLFALAVLLVSVFFIWFRAHQKALNGFKRLVMFVLPARLKAVCGDLVTSIWEGFEVLNQKRSLGIIALLNLVFWCLAATMIFVYMKAFHVVDVPFYAPLFILMAQIIGFMIPSPGYIGPYHAATVVALSFFDVSGEQALSVAIIMHAALFVTNSLPGVIYLWIANLSLSTVISRAKVDLAKNQDIHKV